MGKCCLRRSCRQRLSPAVDAAAYLTLRSGRRVPAAAGRGSPRQRQRRSERCCGKAGGASAARQRRGRRVLASQAGVEEAELPPSLESTPVAFCTEGCGGDRRVAPHSGEAKRDHHDSNAAVVELRPASVPPEEEIEAFLAAAELAERRRFMETYNYDIALDRPLEGRFVWSPVVST